MSFVIGKIKKNISKIKEKVERAARKAKTCTQ